MFIVFMFAYELLCVRVIQLCVGVQGKDAVYECIFPPVCDRVFFMKLLCGFCICKSNKEFLYRAFCIV